MSDVAGPDSSTHSQPHTTSLHADSYTARRLQHATPEHLYLTSRRCFIGPIPEGWLKDHRRDWYKQHLHISYSSRAATFTADSNVSRTRRLTGLEGPSITAAFLHSFPQPKDVQEEGEDAQKAGVTAATPPVVSIPRASNVDEHVTERERPAQGDPGAVPITQGSQPLESTISKQNVKSPIPPKIYRKPRSESIASFVTAPETPLKRTGPAIITEEASDDEEGASQSYQNAVGGLTLEPRGSWVSQFGVPSSTTDEPLDAIASTSSLIRRDGKLVDVSDREVRTRVGVKDVLSEVTRSPQAVPGSVVDGAVTETSGRKSRIGVRFDASKDLRQAEMQVKARVTQMGLRRMSRKMRTSRAKHGQIIKMEKMLVRVDATAESLPEDYDENQSQRTISRTVSKWKEFMVVCREHVDDDAEFVLQIYGTRVIADVEDSQTHKRSKYEIRLGRGTAKVNLYSSLSKTLVIWEPRERQGCTIFLLQPQTGANAVEWYTFLRNILGWHRSSELQVNIPDLSVSLRLEDPFEQLEAARDHPQVAEGDSEALMKTMQEEEAIAGKIVNRSLDMLKTSPEWSDIIDAWTKGEQIGLAWKRYDRLEWVHGANERKMYGTIAMQRSHELELRPKQHYPTITRTHKGDTLTEPAPVEGFLIRLTSQRGINRKLGRMFFKRLYFSTHDQYLVFLRPAKTTPPPPPTLPVSENSKIPTAHQIAVSTPIVYAVNPFPVVDGHISWLAADESTSAQSKTHHDQDAYDEAERKVNTLLNCDGYVNLCDVVRVRNVFRGATPADENVDEGSDVDFNAAVPDTRRDDGVTRDFDDERTFELVMRNELVIRLQAYDKMTKQEWMKRLRELARYWRHRNITDIGLYKAVRQRNLEELHIDEETEAVVGQFARKWEVTKTYASPELHNMCGISCCRTIHISGTLFRKPRRHSTFTRCSVILCSGRLLIFQDTLRTRTGKEVAHIHHERISTLDLKDCYLYSGLLTENDLLYQNRTFDSNKPGHHALPRIYLEDGWTSTDEDVMTCFVLWYGQRKAFFRSPDEGATGRWSRTRLKRVSQLGASGRGVVFKARSRAERDHWVLAIGVELERCGQASDVRITRGQEKKKRH